ncbi:MAG: PIN domain-containing protein [Bifidobacteriaceae bacterium]|jgi:predicted nucleic acid-binding protein|nr:PIN domain-containing protein [Bifidobacteriaceae bacterium]
MGRRLILDTGVIIALERGRLAASDFLQPADEVGFSVVTLAELKAGLALATHQHRPRMERFLDALLTVVQVLPYDATVLEHHARLLAWTRRNGVPRGSADLIVAATAAATGRVLLSADERARFSDLPGVEAQLLTA